VETHLVAAKNLTNPVKTPSVTAIGGVFICLSAGTRSGNFAQQYHSYLSFIAHTPVGMVFL
jgi:hypothetical protein